ncbi:tyrosine-type recombinase/integrase [bacterium]|nr:tyrosine-type recombinase/integrase [bacterium]
MGVYKDKSSGNFGIRVRYYGKDFKKIIGTDKRKAELAWLEIQNEIKLAKLSGQDWQGFEKLRRATKPRTFAKAASDYLEERAHYKASTLSTYRYTLSRDLLPAFGNHALQSIGASELRKFQSKLSDRVSPTRVNTVMQLLRSILSNEEKEGNLDKDPSRAVRRLTERKPKIDPLSEEDLEIALSHVDAFYKPLYTVLAFTGARPNEMLALKWQDIDWKKESISITKGRVRGVEGMPKTRSSEREIPMLPRVKEALEELKQRPTQSRDGYIFIDKKGMPINKHLDRIWSRGLRAAGLRHRPSYQLRHSFATQCIMKGFPLPYIAKLLGHSTIDTLVRHYAGWIDAATRENDNKLREAFKSTPLTPELTQKWEVKREG